MRETTNRTKWSTAAELQEAADRLRDLAPDLTGPLSGLADPVADWLDATANAMAWLAPYRPGENGYEMWQAAMKIANKINGEGGTSMAEEIAPPECGWNPAQASPDCDFGKACPVHGAKEKK